jgi:hypothetical protein
MVLANPSTTPTNAVIHTRLDGGALEPETVSLPGRTAVSVDLGRRVPAGVGFSVQVLAPVPIVAESLLAVRAPFPSADRGIATEIGTSRAAPRWVDSPARANPASLDRVVVLNPGTRPVTFHLTEHHAGRVSTPPKMARVRLAPGKRAVVDLNALNVRPDAFVVVDATGPVVVDRESAGMPGVTAAAVIPDFNS